MGYAKPTAARLIDQRARRRATQALVAKYRDEFATLYEMHRRAAEVEAGVLAEKASEQHPTEEPPRLMPGARKPGQDVTERIDVARCPHCVSHHDRGHVCPECGASPDYERTETRKRVHVEDVEFILDADGRATYEHMAGRMGVTKDTVYQALRRAGRSDLIDRLTRNSGAAGVAS